MLILLPPSEGKATPHRGKPLDLDALSSPALTSARTAVIDALTRLCSADLEAAREALGLSAGQNAEIERNAHLLQSPTARADQIYTGVLYDALDLDSLPAAAKRRATTRVAVTSSVFGLLRPGDRIPPYRLSGDVTLPGLGGVAAHWRQALSGVAEEMVGTGLLVDLRSGMYASFWRPGSDLATRTATVRVLHEQGGVRKVVSHFNKATKGRIVRDLMIEGVTARTPATFAEALRDLGWQVEIAEPTAKGTQLDVVVAEL